MADKRDLRLPWKVSKSPDYGLVIEDAGGSVVAFFAYPDDPERRTYDGSDQVAKAIVRAMKQAAP